jgi:hypothetical protein
LPRQSDQFEGAQELPRPELNPLLNPVLGENMGRWAEVYFTSPPEKREEAVLELLRELEAANPREVPFASEPLAASAKGPAVASRTLPFVADAVLVPCPTCGHENPQSHQFCGMCGGRMFPQNELADFPIRVFHHEDHETQRSDPGLARPIEPFAPDPRLESRPAPSFNFNESPGNPFDTNPHDLSLFRAVHKNDAPYDPSGLAWEHSPSRPYRVYVGAVLALVIMALAYMAWRGSQAASQSSHAATPAPVPASETTAPQTTPAAPLSADESNQPSSPKNLPEVASNAPAETTTSKKAAAPPSATERPSTAVDPTPIPASSAQPPIPAGWGREELAVAQRYLNGSHGEQRNSAEAAKWLWKSIAKHNSEATLMLADLYLKGDGVSKNCDQARVLLDTAARQGMTGAGERLRNLQAFGCQ